MKEHSIKLPLTPCQLIAPPLPLAMLLSNWQFFNVPYFPVQYIAPPSAVKLKFQKEKKSYQHDCFKECLSLEKIKILRKIAIKYPIQAIKINFFKKK